MTKMMKILKILAISILLTAGFGFAQNSGIPTNKVNNVVIKKILEKSYTVEIDEDGDLTVRSPETVITVKYEKDYGLIVLWCNVQKSMNWDEKETLDKMNEWNFGLGGSAAVSFINGRFVIKYGIKLGNHLDLDAFQSSVDYFMNICGMMISNM